ncbi:hypothetical protein WN48_07629 [Eufriesea mexicana]|uniref:Uncharacterized protein n=1 Tax=Eufriesea mexicana TaxID=516756 RepID=A0A310SSC8_9HYME|nr:hypothetical protein WN48_07629 [Eufriesea mexicana]
MEKGTELLLHIPGIGAYDGAVKVPSCFTWETLYYRTLCSSTITRPTSIKVRVGRIPATLPQQHNGPYNPAKPLSELQCSRHNRIQNIYRNQDENKNINASPAQNTCQSLPQTPAGGVGGKGSGSAGAGSGMVNGSGADHQDIRDGAAINTEHRVVVVARKRGKQGDERVRHEERKVRFLRGLAGRFIGKKWTSWQALDTGTLEIRSEDVFVW